MKPHQKSIYYQKKLCSHHFLLAEDKYSALNSVIDDQCDDSDDFSKNFIRWICYQIARLSGDNHIARVHSRTVTNVACLTRLWSHSLMYMNVFLFNC